MGNMKKYSTTEVDYWKVLTVSVKKYKFSRGIAFFFKLLCGGEGL